ncbi:MAG TPA: hypothetical protein VEW05_11940 [Candidatus Polarisedimenticolia bacterium]|nr:hypothetical protein [Candidatus Polarisedimenticolia bacterium]
MEDLRASRECRDLMEQALNSDGDPPVLSGEDIEQTDPDEDFEKGPPGLAFCARVSEALLPAW